MVKRKFLTKLMAATIVATMLVTPTAAFAEGNEEPVENVGEGDPEPEPQVEEGGGEPKAEEVSSEPVESGEEISSEPVKSGEEVSSEPVKSGEEAGSEVVKSGESTANTAAEYIDARNEDVNTKLDDVKAESGQEAAVRIDADNQHKAEVKTGNVTGSEATAVVIRTDSQGNVDLTVDGKTESKGVDLLSVAKGNSDVTVRLDGEVKSDNTGIIAMSGSFNNTRSIDVDPSAEPDKSMTAIMVDGDINAGQVGVMAVAAKSGQTLLNIKGNVSANSSVALSTTALYGGYNDIAVKGNVTAGGSPAVSMQADEDAAHNNIVIGGDVKAGDLGVLMTADGNGTKNEIVIEGTLSAEKTAVASNDSSKNTITVWKIETADDSMPFATTTDGGATLVQDESVEQNIQYIIRVNQTEGATLKATDANGNPLATVTGIDGRALEYAHEGEKVLLKIDVDDHYRLDAAYGDDGRQLELVKDGNGNYYINVPKYGGVSFSVKLTHVKHHKHKDKDKDKDKNKNNNPAASYVLTDSAAVILINSAAPGSAVTLSGLSGTGLSASVVQSLLLKRNIAVTVTFMFNGVLYKVIIPAGADLTPLIDATGCISFAALAQTYGMTPV